MRHKAWFKLFRDPDEHAPTGRRLKAWLFGAEIPVSSALFPIESYGGNIVSDLFGEERYFDDAAKFWKLQTEAVIHKQAAYLQATAHQPPSHYRRAATARREYG